MVFFTPNNFKSGKLIFNRFRIIDLVIVIGLFALSFVSFFMYVQFAEKINYLILIGTLIPAAIAFFLTMRFPVQHNYLEYQKIKMKYYSSQKNFVWEGVYRFGINISKEKNHKADK